MHWNRRENRASQFCVIAMNKTNIHLLLIASSFLLTGFIETYVSVESQNAIAITHMIFLSIVFFSWCKSHAELYAVKEPRGAALLCGLIALIGVPAYFYRAFGAKVGTIKTLRSLVFFLFSVSLYSVAYYIVVSIGQ